MTKKTKRIWKITTAVILLLLLSFWAYVKYEVDASYNTPLPRNTSAVLRIDMFNVYRSMLPGYFKEKKKGSYSSPLKGISIPANIFLYTVRDRKNSTWFGSVPVNDVTAFERSLKKYKALLPVPVSVNGIKVISNGAWTVAYTATRAAFAYTAKQEEVQSVLLELLQKPDFTIAESKFKDIKNQDGHITFNDGINKASLQFREGVINLFAEISSSNIKAQPNAQVYKTTEPIALNFWLQANFSAMLKQKQFSLDSFTIHGDSLLHCQLNGMQLMIGKPVLQKDSVVTYAYNDDFEKVPIVSITEHAVPGIYGWINAEGNLLDGYLKRAGIINDSAMVNKAVFPLYRLYTFTNSNNLLLTTTGSQPVHITKISTPDCFHLDADFTLLQQDGSFTLLHPYIKSLWKLNASAQSNGNKIELKAQLHFNDNSKNALWLLSGLFR